MPLWVLNAHLEQLPRLEAEEGIDQVHYMALGSGSLPEGTATRMARELGQKASGSAGRAPTPPDQLAGALRRMGATVRRV